MNSRDAVDRSRDSGDRSEQGGASRDSQRGRAMRTDASRVLPLFLNLLNAIFLSTEALMILLHG